MYVISCILWLPKCYFKDQIQVQIHLWIIKQIMYDLPTNA